MRKEAEMLCDVKKAHEITEYPDLFRRYTNNPRVYVLSCIALLGDSENWWGNMGFDPKYLEIKAVRDSIQKATIEATRVRMEAEKAAEKRKKNNLLSLESEILVDSIMKEHPEVFDGSE